MFEAVRFSDVAPSAILKDCIRTMVVVSPGTLGELSRDLKTDKATVSLS